VLLHILSVSPDSSFDESYLGILSKFVLNLKPNIALVIDFIHKFRQGAEFKKLIAHLIFHLSKKMKEIIAINLGVGQGVPEQIS